MYYAIILAIGALVWAWVRIRQLAFDVEFHELDTQTVLEWYTKNKAEYDKWRIVARANHDRFTAEIAALKKKNATLKGQITKARKKASVHP